jgi:hypothetical protein
MDVLSDAIAAMRTGRPHSARAERAGRWAVRHPAFAGAGFHIVLQGSCRLTPEGGTPASLGPGDVVFLPHGSAHALSDGSPGLLPDSPPAPLTSLRDESRPGSSVVMLCGAYLLDGVRPPPAWRTAPGRPPAGPSRAAPLAAQPHRPSRRRAHPPPPGDGCHRARAARRAADLPDPRLP